MQWRGPNMQQGLCRSIVWEIMRSHVVDQTHHQPDIIMSTTNIIITIILKIIVIVILTIISTPCFSSRHIRHITMDLLSSNLWKGHGRRHEAIQQCSRSFTKSERTHDRMKPNICTKRSCMMIYICVWQNKMPFLRACKVSIKLYGCNALIDKSQKHYFLRIFGRICRSTPVERARQELKLKLGHELLFTKEIFNIKLFHLNMKDLQWKRRSRKLALHLLQRMWCETWIGELCRERFFLLSYGWHKWRDFSRWLLYTFNWWGTSARRWVLWRSLDLGTWNAERLFWGRRIGLIRGRANLTSKGEIEGAGSSWHIQMQISQFVLMTCLGWIARFRL